MVCLSAAILTKKGKVLLSRQFVPMTRIRIEGLLASFPKLMGSGESQHTFIETDNVRYVYQGVEDLFMVLITNKQSNIMEDLHTLRLMCKIIPEYAGGQTESDVIANCFDLVMAFDEVISIGYKENVTLQQVRTFTTMDSHEEKLQKIIMESKMNEARDEARRKAKSIETHKQEMRKMQGFGSNGDSFGSSGFDDGFSSSSSSSSFSSSSSSSSSSFSTPEPEPEPEQVRPKKKGPRTKGWALGKSKSSKDDFLMKMAKEEKIDLTAPVTRKAGGIGAGSSSSVSEAVEAAVSNETSVQIELDEKLTLIMDRSGSLRKMQINGKMKLCIFDPDDDKLIIHTNGPLNTRDGFKIKLHPKIDKKAWSKAGELRLANESKGFPVGSGSSTFFFQWRKVIKDESEIPFGFTIWPSEEDGQTVVSVECELEKTELQLQDVLLQIPCPQQPDIRACDGEWSYRNGTLFWNLGELNEDASSSSLEFAIPEVDDSECFFPINADFTSPTTYSGLDITDVTRVDGSTPDYTANVTLSPDKFEIIGDDE